MTHANAPSPKPPEPVDPHRLKPGHRALALTLLAGLIIIGATAAYLHWPQATINQPQLDPGTLGTYAPPIPRTPTNNSPLIRPDIGPTPITHEPLNLAPIPGARNLGRFRIQQAGTIALTSRWELPDSVTLSEAEAHYKNQAARLGMTQQPIVQTDSRTRIAHFLPAHAQPGYALTLELHDGPRPTARLVYIEPDATPTRPRP